MERALFQGSSTASGEVAVAASKFSKHPCWIFGFFHAHFWRGSRKRVVQGEKGVEARDRGVGVNPTNAKWPTWHLGGRKK